MYRFHSNLTSVVKVSSLFCGFALVFIPIFDAIRPELAVVVLVEGFAQRTDG